MKTDRSVELGRRAAVHSALGDPGAAGDRGRPGPRRHLPVRAPGRAGDGVEPARPPRRRAGDRRGGAASAVRGRSAALLPDPHPRHPRRTAPRGGTHRTEDRVRLHRERRPLPARRSPVGRQEHRARRVGRHPSRRERPPRRARRGPAPRCPARLADPPLASRRAARRRRVDHGVRPCPRGAPRRPAAQPLVDPRPGPARHRRRVRPRLRRADHPHRPARTRRPPRGHLVGADLSA